MSRVATILGAVVGAATTLNGYRPLSKRRIPSVFAWLFGLLSTELPWQCIAVRAAALLGVSHGLPPRLRRFLWLVTAISGAVCSDYTGSGVTPTDP